MHHLFSSKQISIAFVPLLSTALKDSIYTLPNPIRVNPDGSSLLVELHFLSLENPLNMACYILYILREEKKNDTSCTNEFSIRFFVLQFTYSEKCSKRKRAAFFSFTLYDVMSFSRQSELASLNILIRSIHTLLSFVLLHRLYTLNDVPIPWNQS